ncbi:MAG TPA: tetratricopeptide repeat protein [Thermoanaerobaculia bacterium]|jgi:cytochrome c-type biogenesis protein CcmH|nr:tetratricopeptide repeat protein [Thermoanaerobaculia bacterium]
MIDLISAAGMFAAGLVLGGLLLYSLSRRKVAVAAPDIERLDLEVKRDALLRQLREVDDNPEERLRLEQEAATVLRELERRSGSPAGPTVAPPKSGPAREPAPRSPTPPPNSAMRGFLWGAGSVAAVALLFWLVTSQLKQRSANDQVTGNPLPATTSQQPATTADPAVQQLEAAVQQNPNDLNLRINLAKAYLDHENLMAVFEQTKFVLEKSPDNAKALTYQALVRMAMGQMPEATTMLEKATRSDPTLLDAWVGLAWIRVRMGKTEEAEQAIREAQKQHPEEAARLDGVFQEMKSRAGQAPAATPAASAPSGPAVHIAINMEGTPKPGSVIFVLARAAGVTAGPPAAVKRLPVTAFPMTVDLGAADSMLGQPLPEKLRIEARLDSDGDATTKDPSDPKAAEDNVSVGSTVQLTLK